MRISYMGIFFNARFPGTFLQTRYTVVQSMNPLTTITQTLQILNAEQLGAFNVQHTATQITLNLKVVLC